jgi:enolase
MLEIDGIEGRAVGDSQGNPTGETGGTTIADLVEGCGHGIMRTGSASRSDRIAPYTRRLRTENELGSAARFAGRETFNR